jgi:heat shock protein HslJ
MSAVLALATALPPFASAQEQPPPRRQAPPRIGDDLVGTSWQAETLLGEKVADPLQATIDFLPGDHVRGQIACNRFVGPFATRAKHITIGPVRVSRLRCGEGAALQKTLVDVLHYAQRAELSEDRLELIGSHGAPSRFVRRTP